MIMNKITKFKKLAIIVLLIILITITVLSIMFYVWKVNIISKLSDNINQIQVEIGDKNKTITDSLEINELIKNLKLEEWQTYKNLNKDNVPVFYIVLNEKYLLRFFNYNEDIGYCDICYRNSYIELQTYCFDIEVYNEILKSVNSLLS